MLSTHHWLLSPLDLPMHISSQGSSNVSPRAYALCPVPDSWISIRMGRYELHPNSLLHHQQAINLVPG